MHPLEVRYRPEALADLEDIYRFVLKRSMSPKRAFDFVKRIQARCAKIGILPEGGRPRDDRIRRGAYPGFSLWYGSSFL